MRPQSFILFTSLLLPCLASAQSLEHLKHPAPYGAQEVWQLTDGRILAQSYRYNGEFWTLTPDENGSYVKGTWKKVAGLWHQYSPVDEASQVLADGRLLIEGGEYNHGNFELTNMGAVYDPVKDTWTSVDPPKGWQNIGDSPSVVLPNGHFLLGDKLHKRGAELDPATMSWKAVGYRHKNDFNAEEGWTLMPDGSVLTLDVLTHPFSEAYLPWAGEWQMRGKTVAHLAGPPCCRCTRYQPSGKFYCPPGEIGPAILRPDGTVFATGALPAQSKTGHTAIFTPHSGWSRGPDFPNGDNAGDDFAVLLTNGDVLVQGRSGQLYEFDGTNFTGTGIQTGHACLIILPTGQVLVGGGHVFNSTGRYRTAWQPAISKYPAAVTRGSTYRISGTQFNGLSQANALGDEHETSTNYPLVRITNKASGHVFYARTHDHSTMGVATGSETVWTHFDVPPAMETGAGMLEVVANGIPSDPVEVVVK
ncbi:MAG TPA: hypothetical protein VHT03_10690 [Rhizomicrobium sp.]|jgi:hypothetical protein|nr:hypothetical protein [Rhizomicrobium sp.]